MGNIRRRLELLEDRAAPETPSEARSEARARMRAYLDEIAAARREGRAPSEEAEAVMEAFERRRARGS
jgi:cytochrome P450